MYDPRLPVTSVTVSTHILPLPHFLAMRLATIVVSTDVNLLTLFIVCLVLSQHLQLVVDTIETEKGSPLSYCRVTVPGLFIVCRLFSC